MKRWRAKIGGQYFTLLFIFGFFSSCSIDDGGEYANNSYQSGNYFKTKKQADKEVKKRMEKLKYFCIRENKIEQNYDLCGLVDLGNKISGNYFRTRKEAEAKLKQIKKILKG